LLQSSHRRKVWHESDFAGRVATRVRRNAQASSKAFFMVFSSLRWLVNPGNYSRHWIMQAPQVSDTGTPPQTTWVQRCFSGVGVMMLQSRHTLMDTQSSDFAGRVATAVRKQAQMSSRTLVFFTVGHLLGIGASPWGPKEKVRRSHQDGTGSLVESPNGRRQTPALPGIS